MGPAEKQGNITRNLPLEYVRERTGLDITVYRKIARMVNAHACSAAEEIAGLMKAEPAEPTEDLIHFFHSAGIMMEK